MLNDFIKEIVIPLTIIMVCIILVAVSGVALVYNLDNSINKNKIILKTLEKCLELEGGKNGK